MKGVHSRYDTFRLPYGIASSPYGESLDDEHQNSINSCPEDPVLQHVANNTLLKKQAETQYQQILANAQGFGIDSLPNFISSLTGVPGYGVMGSYSNLGNNALLVNPDEETLLYYYHSNHLGSTSLLTDIDGEVYQYTAYMPFGEAVQHRRLGTKVSPYLFNGKERDRETGLYYYGARFCDPTASLWLSVYPLADEREWLSPYNFVQNNPINRIDPDGALDEPVYGSDGTYRGDTKEGFTGEVIIYDGKEDFTKLTKNQLLSKKGADTYDNQRGSLTGSAKSKIWTNIASDMEGQQIYDEKFSLSSLSDGKIGYSSTDPGSWNSRLKSKTITGTDKYSYETTVENIQSSIVVHEWYSHIKKGQGAKGLSSHRLAYKNVINYKSLWNNTTDAYKGFNVRQLLKYTKYETGRTKIDPLYRNLYNTYKNKR